ncbi:MAG: hypothetical protein ACTSPY_05135 [Candidatus Helarchaeota archaeon]
MSKKILISFNIFLNSDAFYPPNDKSTTICYVLQNKYDFTIEIHAPIYIYAFEGTNNENECWELRNNINKPRGKIINRIKLTLRPNEEKKIFEHELYDLFFNTNSWTWLWICRKRKTSISPIYRSLLEKEGYKDKLELSVKIQARLIAKVSTIKPEPEAAWNFECRLIIPIVKKI